MIQQPHNRIETANPMLAKTTKLDKPHTEHYEKDAPLSSETEQEASVAIFDQIFQQTIQPNPSPENTPESPSLNTQPALEAQENAEVDSHILLEQSAFLPQTEIPENLSLKKSPESPVLPAGSEEIESQLVPSLDSENVADFSTEKSPESPVLSVKWHQNSSNNVASEAFVNQPKAREEEPLLEGVETDESQVLPLAGAEVSAPLYQHSTVASFQGSKAPTQGVTVSSATKTSVKPSTGVGEAPSALNEGDDIVDEHLGRALLGQMDGSGTSGATSAAMPVANIAVPGMALQSQQRLMEQWQRQQVTQRQQAELKADADSGEAEELLTSLSAGGERMSSALGVDKAGATPTSFVSITHAITSQKWGEALGKHLQVAANQSLQKMQITLNPEKLGPIQVHLHLSKDKQLHIGMAANHMVTREAMMEALPRLREMLESQGVSLGSLDVREEGFSEQGLGQDGQSSQQGAHGRELSDADGLIEDVGLAQNLLARAQEAGRVDFYA